MRRSNLRDILLCALALWMQLLAPVAAMAPEDAADPFAIICSHGSPGQDVPSQSDHGHRHQHCLLCQAGFGGPPLIDRTPVVAPVRPMARRLAWRPNLARAPPTRTQQRQQPRGPPTLL